MGIFDLLKALAGGGNASAGQGPEPATPGASGGVGAMLSPTAEPASASVQAQPVQTNVPDLMPPGVRPAPAPQSATVERAPTPDTQGIQPSTPPTMDAGLGGFLSNLVHKATTRNANTGMSFMDKLGDLGASITDGQGTTEGAEQNLRAEAAGRVAQTRRAQLMQMAEGLGMSPREKLVFTADPDAWVKANADRFGYHAQAGGTTGYYGEPGQGGSTSTTAPVVGQDRGEGYKVTPEGITDLGGISPSPQQQLEDDVKRAREEAMNAYHTAMARAAQQRANADTTRANRPPALGNGGNWLPPGARVVHMPGS